MTEASEQFVTYEVRDNIAHVQLDHGKANTLSSAVVAQLDAALDRAEKAGPDKVGALILTGTPGFLTGGFDLEEMKADPKTAGNLVCNGGALCTRMYGSPVPIVIACPGHAIAAGALLLLSADERIGVSGKFKLGLIETQIGMVLPRWAIELGQERLSKRHQQAAMTGGRNYTPEAAMAIGFLDDVVAPNELERRAIEAAKYWAGLPRSAYIGQVKMIRGERLRRLEAAVAADRGAGFSVNAP